MIGVDEPQWITPKHSLLQTATVHRGERWVDGVGFVPHLCTDAHIADATCPPGTVSPAEKCPGVTNFYPYLLEIQVTDLPTQDLSWAEARLELATSSLLEEKIAAGVTSAPTGGHVNPGLAGGTAITAPTGASAAVKVAALENEMLKVHAGAGVLYMAPSVAVQAHDLLYADGDLVRTRTIGSKVVIGNFPANAAYAHAGDVDVYLDPIMVNETFDRAKNDKIVHAYRYATAVWATCRAWKVTI